MKKIIWIFGESATGKLTFINNLYNGDENTLNTFNMLNKKIDICKVTLEDRVQETYNECYIDPNEYDDSMMDNDNLYFNRQRAIHRRSFIIKDVESFLQNDSDVLLIKGQENDMNPKRGDIINNFLVRYSNIKDVEIDVIILQVTDEKEHKKRIENKPWFKAMSDEQEKQRLLNAIPLKKEIHKQKVINSFIGNCNNIYTVESLDGSYRKDGMTYGKSSNFRR